MLFFDRGIIFINAPLPLSGDLTPSTLPPNVCFESALSGSPPVFRIPPTVHRRCCSRRRIRTRIRLRTSAVAVARRYRILLSARSRWIRCRTVPPPVPGTDCGCCNRRHRRTPKIRRPRTWPPARRCPRAPCSVADGTASGTWTCTAKTVRRTLHRCCDRISRCRSDHHPC